MGQRLKNYYKLTPELKKKAKQYLKTAVDEEYEFHKLRGGKVDGYDEKVRVNLPTLGGLAIYLDVNKDTLYEWGKVDNDISELLTRIITIQEQRLIDGAISGRYNPIIAKLILSARHEYREKTDTTSDGKAIGGNTIIFKDYSDDSGDK